MVSQVGIVAVRIVAVGIRFTTGVSCVAVGCLVPNWVSGEAWSGA
jgi:hypothetical protein